MTMPSVQEPQRIKATTPRTSVWPVVLGVLSIVAGIDAMGLFGIPPAGSFLDLGRRFAQGGFPAALEDLGGWWGLACVASFACGGMLAVLAGVMLLLRRRAALVLHWLYALGVLGGVGLLLVFVLGPEVEGVPARFLFRILTPMAMGLIYPVLVMVWFSRPSVRRHMRLWRSRAKRAASRPAGPIWPTVLGTLALYWGATGAMGALLAGIGLLLPLKGPGLHGMSYGWYNHAVGWGWLVLSGLSVAWGILLRRRRPAGVVLCWVYVAGAVMCALGTPIPAVVRIIEIRWKFDAWFLLQGAASLGARTLGMLAWPVFLLIWFARPGIRAQVRSWRAGPPPPVPEGPS
ncbi:MAG TPA: hypothetical protein VM389_11335 [Phycisphaerae bacterium]|nr:hypothetical protein [Phycisphaerae bacterium]